MKKVGKIIGGVVLTVLLLALAATVISLLQNNTAGKKEAGKITKEESSSWMSQLTDETPLSLVNLPGTHDAATQYVQLSFFSKCQGKNIKQQLEDGYRYLDIRLGETMKDDTEALCLMHGFTFCKTSWLPWTQKLYLDQVLEQCYAFLQENPTETVVFVVKHEHGDMTTADFQMLLQEYVQSNPQMWYLKDQIPTVGEARGKIVLARRYEDEAGLMDEAGLAMDWINQPGHEDVSLHMERNDNSALTLYVQDRYEYGSKDKWKAFINGVDAQKEELNSKTVRINFVSTKGTLTYGHPYAFAKKLNKYLLSQDLPSETQYGWVIMDFGNAALARRIYETNFR